jgi:RND family efflux transporter MFP subunit
MTIKKISIGVVVVVAISMGGYFTFFRHAPAYQFVSVEQGSIIQTVSVTGNTVPIKSVSLGFQNTGTVARVYHELGDYVSAGEIIAELNTANLSAALQQAQGAYDAAVASRSSTSLPEVATQARNTYLSAYTTLDTLLINDVDTFFGDATVYGPQLLINAPMYNFGDLSKERAVITNEMRTYQQSLAGVASTDPKTLLARATATTQLIASFLDKLAVAANDTNTSATSAQLTLLSTARTGVSALLATLSTAQDTYLRNSVGATSLADASVAQARAGVAAVEANFQGTKIVAPISGTLTQQDAKVGQLASPGTPLVSMIGSGGFEADAGASETDIGKITLGDKVMITLDAFPNETFSGSVFYIAPSETNTQGVVSYQIKISFDKSDPRLKSGLTANIDIQTKHKDAVLILPQYAILQNDEGTFVETLVNNTVTRKPVALGIQDQKGSVEILSGVTLGEQVLNIGLKSQ